MPKLCKHYIKINGQDRVGDIFYTPSTKTFYFNFPKEISEWGSVKYPDRQKYLVYDESQAGLEKKIKELISEYEKDALKERKVIAYKFENKSSRAELAQELKEKCEDEYDRERAIAWAAREPDEVQIKLTMHTLLERTVGSNKQLLREEVDGHGVKTWEPCGNWSYDDFTIMDWSPAAEKFFNDLYGGCEELIKRIDLFTGTPEKVKKAIKNSSRPLEGPSTKEKA